MRNLDDAPRRAMTIPTPPRNAQPIAAGKRQTDGSNNLCTIGSGKCVHSKSYSTAAFTAAIGTMKVARWVQPPRAKIDNAMKVFFQDFIVRLAVRFRAAPARCTERPVQ